MGNDGWSILKLGDLAATSKNALVGGPFGSELGTKDYVACGVPVIRGQNMGSRWVGHEFTFVTEEKAERLSANLARPGDLVFTQRGTIGQVSLVPEMPYDRYLISQSQMKITVDRSMADPLFMYYVFRSDEQQDYIRRNAIQTGVPHTNLGILRATPIIIPSLSEQRAIARILGSLDDKIECNRRMNRTLEAIARAIFQSWFVDFDPVLAKMDGRAAAGMDAATAALFPEHFEDSELGKIPTGWTVTSLGDIVGINECSLSRNYPHAVIEYIDISSVTIGRLDGTTSYPLVEAPSRAKRLVQHGDTIWSCVRPNHRSYLFIHKPAENLVVSTGFAVLTPQSIGANYLYAWTTAEDFVQYLTANADGSAYPAVRPEHFARASILRPIDSVMRRFEEILTPLRDKIAQNECESRTLAALRDTLLPKLISGELRVPEAERLVGRAT